MPKKRTAMIKAKLDNNLVKLKSPDPINPYLKHSKIGVKGFKSAKKPQLPNFCFTKEVGKITGVNHINKLTPKPKSRDKSLYFVVSEENIIPNPNENNARKMIRTGENNAHALGCTSSRYM